MLVAAAMYDLFQAVLLPRPSVGRAVASPVVVRILWRVWRRLFAGIPQPRRREAALAAFGPVSLITLLALWVLALLFGYALLQQALRGQWAGGDGSLGTALYVSAQSLLTLGFGGVVPMGAAARIVATAEATTGLGVVALVISLLFSMFQAFGAREVQVVDLDATAGAPPSGVQILENCAKLHIDGHLVQVLRTWRQWSAQVLESHLAYPVLVFFRSSHDNEAWLNSFGAVLDAAALLATTIEGCPATGEAALTLKVGRHTVDDFAVVLHLPRTGPPGLERSEFDEARARLIAAGYRLRDADAAWQAFAELRSHYAPALAQLARYLVLPPAPWLGDRSYLPHVRPQGGSRRRLDRVAAGP